MFSGLCLLGVYFAVACLANLSHAEDAPVEKITYDDHIQPIFRQHCLSCHSADTKKSDLAIDAYATTLEGGASGEVVVPGSLEESRLWALVSHEEEPNMPPESDRLPDDKLALLKRWIEGGALENSGSVAKVKKNTGIAMLENVATGKPEGPAAMPAALFREPIIHTTRAAAVTSIAASPWAPLIAVAGQRQISIYHSDSTRLLGILPFLEGVPQVLVFSRDGSKLLAAGGRGAAVGLAALYDVKTGSRLATIGDEYDTILAADFNAQQTLVAMGGPQKIVRVYSTSDETIAFEIRKHTDWITAIGFAPDGKTLLSADRNGGAFLWEADTGREIASLRGHSSEITSVSWRADSKIVATSGADGTVRLWGAEEGNQVKSWAAHGGGTTSVAFAADGRLVTVGRDKVVKLWKADGGHLKDLSSFTDIALACCFSHDGKRVAAGDYSGEVRLIDIASGQQVGLLPPNPPTLAMRLTSATAHLESITAALGEATAAKQEAFNKLAAVKNQSQDHIPTLEVAKAKLVVAQSTLDSSVKDIVAKAAATKAADDQVKQAIAKLNPASAAVVAAEVELAAARNAKADTSAAEALLTAATEQAKQVIAAIETSRQAAKVSLDDQRGAEAAQVAATKTVAAFQQSVQLAQKAVDQYAKQLETAVADVAAKEQAFANLEASIAAGNQAIADVKADQASFQSGKETLDAFIVASMKKTATEAELLAAAVTAQKSATGEVAKHKAATNDAAVQLAAAQASYDKVKKALDEAQAVENQKTKATRTAELAYHRAEAASEQAKTDKELFEKSQAVRAEHIQ